MKMDHLWKSEDKCIKWNQNQHSLAPCSTNSVNKVQAVLDSPDSAGAKAPSLTTESNFVTPLFPNVKAACQSSEGEAEAHLPAR